MPRLKKAKPAEVPAMDAASTLAVMEPPPPKGSCILDDAPVNSKLVVVRTESVQREPVLMTPDGEQTVPADDLAHTLPLGARIQRRGPSMFHAEQLDAAEDRPPLVAASAAEAIAKFNGHFHGAQD